MPDWFNVMSAGGTLAAGALEALWDDGFVVIPGPVAPGAMVQLAAAYDAAVASAHPDDVAVGSTTTRVSDFVNRRPEFDSLYLYPPLLEASCHVIGQPFKLSTMHARTVRPHTAAQALHVDFERDAQGWPMVGFILMVDEFRSDNGATRFVPGSHRMNAAPSDDEGQVVACGRAGSAIIYNGSIWHGHAANSSDKPRRSIQGAYIRREAESGAKLPARMLPATLARIGPLARYLLAI